MVVGFYQLTSGLDHMHGRQIVDQDVHRGNVLISKADGSWKKGDLGSAARCQRDDGEWNRIHPKDCRWDSGCFANVMMSALALHTAAVKSLLTVIAVLQQKPWSERCAQCKWR